MPVGQLVIGSALIGFTAVLHMAGILAVVTWLRRTEVPHGPDGYKHAIRVFAVAILGVFALHTVEIWCWALLYMVLGEFQSLERALYFSTVTFTTLGYGDITLSARWQLLSGLEAASGIILFGVSTAFVFAVLKYLFEAAGIVGHRPD